MTQPTNSTDSANFGSDPYSLFETFQAPIDGAASQSIADQLAAMQQSTAEVPASAELQTNSQPDSQPEDSTAQTAQPQHSQTTPPGSSADALDDPIPESSVGEQAAESGGQPTPDDRESEGSASEHVVAESDAMSGEADATAPQPTATEIASTDSQAHATTDQPPIEPAAPEMIDSPTASTDKLAATEPTPAMVSAELPGDDQRTTAQPTAQPGVQQKSEASAEQEEPAENGFRKLDLRPEVQQAVEELGYETPTDVQAQIIPHLLAGRDVLAQSQTGTGKTAAFALPILSLVALPTKLPQVIVLTPTRELAMQVADSFTRYGQHLPGFRVAAVYGGTGYDGQIRQLRRGAPIVVGTPGRVIDLIKKGILDLSLIGCCVLDEADEMLNMGFLEDVEFVLQQTPEERQVALFSATMPGPIQSIAKNYQSDPVRISIKRKTMTAEAIRQRAVVVQHRDKLETLTRLLDVEETDGVIIFTRTREATVTVAEHLSREGLAAIALNGDMPQNVRERAIDQLKSGKLDILVATDVAARGLDVSRISHVFNFDVPQDSETYVHRIGRTGRAGRKGEAIILLSNSQRYKLKQIERVTRQSIEVVARPSAADINAARIARFKQKITSVMASEDRTFFAELLGDYSKETGAAFTDIAAALAVMLQNGRPFLAEDRARRERQSRQDEGGRSQRSHGERGERNDRGERRDRYSDRDRRQQNTRPQRRAGRVEAGMERYRIEVGHQDNVRPGNIVGAVANEGGIEGEFIGPINIYDSYSTIDLPEGMPNDVYNVLRQVRVAGKPLQLKKATESDNHGESSARRSNQGRPGQGGPRRFSGKGRPGKNRKFDGRKQRRHG